MVARPTRLQIFEVNCTAPACHDRRAAPGHSTSEMIQEDRKNIDPEQVRKLAGWGLTQNDRASFVGWSQSLISLGF